MNKIKINKLNKISKEIREDIINYSYSSKAHHIGSELSCVEILVTLYFDIMNINKKNIKDKSRDFFILSKGHAALVLYAVLSKKGFFKKSLIKNEFLKNGGRLGGHPDFNSVKGIECSSGSLGHALSTACGIALAKKMDKLNGRVFVLLGDGECNEGMIWEAALFASHHKLNNLIAIVDYNLIQGRGKTSEIINYKSLKNIFESFGWQSKVINGHEINQIQKSMSLKNLKKPLVVIANTVKGKGIKNLENTLESHYYVIESEKDKIKILNEINNK